MSRRKLSPKDVKALNRGRPVTKYPPGKGRAELRIPSASKRERRRRRKRDKERG